MALDGAALGAIITTEISAIANITDQAELSKFSNAIGKAIIEYITANASVTGQVTSGQGAGGTVTGKLS